MDLRHVLGGDTHELQGDSQWGDVQEVLADIDLAVLDELGDVAVDGLAGHGLELA